jgi:tRNA(fMet)-specific endonuclease VapC
VFVVDTNTLVYFFRGQGRVAERLLATPPSSLIVPSVVQFELETGVRKSNAPEQRRAQLDLLLASMLVVPFDSRCAVIAADVRARLEARGTPIGPFDTLIAATALAHDAALVTRNLREFARVDGLRVVDWYA